MTKKKQKWIHLKFRILHVGIYTDGSLGDGLVGAGILGEKCVGVFISRIRFQTACRKKKSPRFWVIMIDVIASQTHTKNKNHIDFQKCIMSKCLFCVFCFCFLVETDRPNDESHPIHINWYIHRFTHVYVSLHIINAASNSLIPPLRIPVFKLILLTWTLWLIHNVDGSEIRRSPVEVGSWSHYLPRF